MSELEDRDIESLVERLNEVEEELAECLGKKVEEVEEEASTIIDVPIGQPLAEWEKRGKVRIKEDGDGSYVCYIKTNKGKEKANVGKVFDFSDINLVSFGYRHTYQTKSGQLKVYLNNKNVYDITMLWGQYNGVIDASEVKGTAELRFELVSRNPWYSTGNVNLYLSTMTGTSDEIGNVYPVFDSFEAKETAVIKSPKIGASVATKMHIRNVGKEKGKIHVVFSDIDKDKILATGNCTLGVMETIFPFIYHTESNVRLSKGGYGGYAFVKDMGERHLGIKIWGEGEKEPAFEDEDTLQMKTWTVNVK